MSWEDFTLAKVIGTRIFRPHSDVLAEIAWRVDNMLVHQPEVGRGYRPIHTRDLIFVYGERGSLLLLSSKAERHLPIHIGGDLAAIHPEYDLTELGGHAKRLQTEDLPADFNAVLANVAFDDPLVVALPPFPFTGENEAKAQVTQEAAQIIFDAEKKRYMDKIENDRPKRIFLSHRSMDKEIVRDVAATLREIGFDPWLDEDAMPAGANLERAIKDGMVSSCAAVFFVTPNFRDEDWLASEVDYATIEKRKKGGKFAIVPLLMKMEDGRRGAILEMFEQYVHKDVKHHQIVREILRALPIRMDRLVWKA